MRWMTPLDFASHCVALVVVGLGVTLGCTSDSTSGDTNQSKGSAGQGGAAAPTAEPEGSDASPAGGGQPWEPPEDPCRDGPLMTRAEYEAATAPIEGPNQVVEQGCDGAPIDDDYAVVPTVMCYHAPDYRLETNAVRNCEIEPMCTRHDECTERPHGRCTGAPYSSCAYPDFDRRPCTSDADCADTSGGTCPTSPVGDRLCYPTGEWGDEQRTCFVREEPCTQDSDCTAAPGGICQKQVRYARCQYYDCLEDADCGASEACACGECIDAGCHVDADCEGGQRCVRLPGCYELTHQQQCTTPLDECASADDCDGLPCEYDTDRWRCRRDGCPIPR